MKEALFWIGRYSCWRHAHYDSALGVSAPRGEGASADFFQRSTTGKAGAHPRSVKPPVHGVEYSMWTSHSTVRLFMHDNRELLGLKCVFMFSDLILLCVHSNISLNIIFLGHWQLNYL